MNPITIGLIILSSIGFLISGFFSAFLLSKAKGNRLINYLLGFLLLALTLRIAKSVFYNFTDLPLVVKNLGLAANLAIGPLLWFYSRALFKSLSFRKIDWLHFIPTFIYIILSPIIPNQYGEESWYWSYGFILFQQFIYLLICFWSITQWKLLWEEPQHRSFVVLYLGISFIWLTFTVIFLGWLPVYLFAAIAYSVLATIIVFLFSGQSISFSWNEKYAQSKIEEKQATQYLDQIKLEIEQNKAFLNPNLSLQDLADKTGLTTKMISQVVNSQEGMNFSTFINTYRIKEAEKRLMAPEFQHFTIVSIAYDCGFNSISSFNTTFKALTQKTPSEYRRSVSV